MASQPQPAINRSAIYWISVLALFTAAGEVAKGYYPAVRRRLMAHFDVLHRTRLDQYLQFRDLHESIINS